MKQYLVRMCYQALLCACLGALCFAVVRLCPGPGAALRTVLNQEIDVGAAMEAAAELVRLILPSAV